MPFRKAQLPIADGSHRPNGGYELAPHAEDLSRTLFCVGSSHEVENHVKLVSACELLGKGPRRVVYNLVQGLGFRV